MSLKVNQLSTKPHLHRVGFYAILYVCVQFWRVSTDMWCVRIWVPSYKLIRSYWFLKDLIRSYWFLKDIFGSFGSLDLLDLSLSWWVSVWPYATVCPYLHRRLAFLLVLRLLAIIHSLTTLLDRMAYHVREAHLLAPCVDSTPIVQRCVNSFLNASKWITGTG